MSEIFIFSTFGGDRYSEKMYKEVKKHLFENPDRLHDSDGKEFPETWREHIKDWKSPDDVSYDDAKEFILNYMQNARDDFTGYMTDATADEESKTIIMRSETTRRDGSRYREYYAGKDWAYTAPFQQAKDFKITDDAGELKMKMTKRKGFESDPGRLYDVTIRILTTAGEAFFPETKLTDTYGNPCELNTELAERVFDAEGCTEKVNLAAKEGLLNSKPFPERIAELTKAERKRPPKEIVLYDTFDEDVYAPEVMENARKEFYADKKANVDKRGVGKWCSPEEIPEDEVRELISSRAENIQRDAADEINRGTEGQFFVTNVEFTTDEKLDKVCKHCICTEDVFQAINCFVAPCETKITDVGGELKIETRNELGESELRARLVTDEGEKICGPAGYESFEYQAKTVFNSDVYSEKPRVAQKCEITESVNYADCFDKNGYNDYAQREPLCWKPNSTWVDKNAYAARMGLLSDEDRMAAEKIFKEDKEARDMFFGCPIAGGTVERHMAHTALKLAEHADKETTSRLFKASYYGSRTSEETAKKMIDEAVNVITEIYERVKKGSTSGMIKFPGDKI